MTARTTIQSLMQVVHAMCSTPQRIDLPLDLGLHSRVHAFVMPGIQNSRQPSFQIGELSRRTALRDAGGRSLRRS